MNVSEDNQLSGMVIGAAIDVHRQLGPELNEVAYEEALARRLTKLSVANRRQVPLPMTYKGVSLDCGYRIDILVENRLPLELKVVAEIRGVHEAQLLTYQRIGGFPLGLLINFNVAALKDGIHRKAETRAWAPPNDESSQIDNLRACDPVSAAIVIAAIEVHRHVGPGMLASSYLACLCHELAMKKLAFEKEKQLAILFDGETLSTPAEVPLVVEGQVPVFPMSVSALTPVHTASVLARLRQGGWKQGLLLNFNSETMTAGIRRVVL